MNEMRARIAAYDWSTTPLGPMAAWPASLRTPVRIIETSRFAMWMGWGPDLTFLYNDAYARDTLAAKHPWALGRPAREVWAEIWNDVGPRIRTVMETGTATWDEGLRLFLERSGFPEETYHTFSYSPLDGDDGAVAGMLCVVTEETDRVISERRLASLGDLAAALATTTTEAGMLDAVARSAGANLEDLPFTLLYLHDAETDRLRLACRTGIDADHPAARPDAWPLAELTATRAPAVVDALDAKFDTLPTGAWDVAPRRAAVVPIASQGQDELAGVLVAALNPYRPFDATYANFVDLVAGQIASSLANVRSYEAERRRAESLAELDRAKTQFFSNVSHEFRTPLTLMLGPAEDALANTETSPENRERLEVIHRNALRLLKLVNTLLDFSRIEAGRIAARYEPLDLAALTAEVASAFRSAMERAGLRFVVDTPPLGEPVYADRDMWEKVVLNLLSNAFKHTFDGEVRVALGAAAGRAELTVRDSGIGIPADQLPHLFERFHRVPNARSRTHEGTGIGLAFVQELVRLHGGTIDVESAAGVGTTFTVRLPLGRAHLPAERVEEAATSAASTAPRAFATEAMRWLPEADSAESVDSPDDTPAEQPSARILIVDDNADMRDYAGRLLRARGWGVATAADGLAALEAVRASLPDVVLSDVMMPGLDGFGLLRALRADDATRTIPVILLSARAGEESRIEGLEAGADDYLVKPFSAQELVARVGAHVALARTRAEATRRAEEARREAERANQAKSDFLAAMSHELRTPLNAIAGYTELIELGVRGPVTDAQRADLERIQRSQRHLLTLINDILNFAKLEAGRVEYDLRAVPLAAVVASAVPIIEPLLVPRGIRYEARVDEALTAWADEEKLRQILLNLLSNAAKFTGPGGVITVDARTEGGAVLLTVTDTGIGISADKQGMIFDPFVQAHRNLTRPTEGTGLGLAISRDLARGMGGDLTVRSVEGEGATFTIVLPTAPAAP